jgi:hypothetical protein
MLLGAFLLGLGLLVLLVTRVRSLGRRFGTFECALRFAGRTAWASGIAGYGADRLEWFRVLSLSPRPAHSWQRSALVVVARSPRLRSGRRTAITEATVRCRGAEFTLAMTDQAYAGLASWLEAAPPGSRPGLVG